MFTLKWNGPVNPRFAGMSRQMRDRELEFQNSRSLKLIRDNFM